MSFRKKLRNVRPAWRAIGMLWREEYSFKVFTLCGALAIILSFVLNISRIEFLFVLLIIGAVLTAEALNTAIEELCDHVTPEQHPKIGKIKEIASGATLIAMCTAFVVGTIIFMPPLISLL